MKKKKESFITISIIFIILVVLTSCYTDYNGYYNLGKLSPTYKLKPASDEDYKKLFNILRKVALEYGFKQLEGESWENCFCFHKGHGDNKGEHEGLEGSKGPFLLALHLGPYPSLQIRDFRRNNETEFMKSLKKSLEKSLSEVIDMEGVTFEREFSLPLGP
jgi:hypothetical protein